MNKILLGGYITSFVQWGTILILFISISSCNNEMEGIDSKKELFLLLESSETGLDFINQLNVNVDLNILNYLYYYNGGGLAAGDFNNDGLIDLFFTANSKEECLYLNKGGLKFVNISERIGDLGEDGWTTGAAVVDINADGFLDIYICQVAINDYSNVGNRLLVCSGIDSLGIPHYQERAKEYGLDFVGLSTHAGFFDYDLDGDLDMYLLNHSLHHNGTFGRRSSFSGTYHPTSGDRLFRNDSTFFKDVTRQSGIESTVIGYGLGLAFGDINNDGYPDIYVGNDFHENDYLYINQKDGTFRDELNKYLMHTSRFSMGCDMADINNDGHTDIMSLDMLPEDPIILKMSEGEDGINVFNYKINSGYNHQYVMNCLQINNGNGSFSEIGRYAGINASDWSWSVIMSDLNLDGKKDIFISNGIPKRMNDIDYINFMSGSDIQYKIQYDKLGDKDLKVIDMIPEIKIKNKFYIHSDELLFDDIESAIGNNKSSYSNSAVLVDLDNDGDVDVVTNNINDEAFVYENLLGYDIDISVVKLRGPKSNPKAIGSKVIFYSEDGIQQYENYSTKGFQSSVINDIIVAKPDRGWDSVRVIWPDGCTQLQYGMFSDTLKFDYDTNNKSIVQAGHLKTFSSALKTVDKATSFGIDFLHLENPYVEFNREPLIPFTSSQHGPALAVGDLNGDGLDDLFLGSSKNNMHGLFFQTQNGQFEKKNDSYLTLDNAFEQVDAQIIDINNDGFNDLIIANGGNEFSLNTGKNKPQIFLNDGKGYLYESNEAFKDVQLTASGLAIADYDDDGDFDIFIGGRAVPFKYGEIPKSYLLENNGNGVFTDVTEQYFEDSGNLGFVRDAIWQDLNNDGNLELIVALEWGGILAFYTQNDHFSVKKLTDKKGWWSMLYPVDYDGDGDLDIIAGNLGLNSVLKSSADKPVRLYFSDFDDNGSKEQLLTYYIEDKEVLFNNKLEIEKQLPFIKNMFLMAKDFAQAELHEIIGKRELDQAKVFEANYFQNAVLINEGNGTFSTKALPFNMQWTTYNDVAEISLNEDGLTDLLFVGNNYGNNIQMGRYDADFGSILVNQGSGDYLKSNISGDVIKGQAVKIKQIVINDKQYLAVARNDDKLMILDITVMDTNQ